MDEKFLRNVDKALGNWLGNDVQEPPRFGGKFLRLCGEGTEKV